jgi:hypothetical protein
MEGMLSKDLPRTQDSKEDEVKHVVIKNCLLCRFFVSFQSDYEDALEPDDQGFCHCSKSPFYGNEGAGKDVVCDFIIDNP